jgi:putative tryptophan/tyrosine transport system substrate-binding protein
MRRREFITALGSATAWPLILRAQPLSAPVIGFLSTRSAKDSQKVIAAFGQGLAEAGFAIPKDVSVEYRFAEGHLDRLPELAADLVNKKVTIIAAVGGASSAVAAKNASRTIPIVFVMGGDPIKLGLADSIARPGGNSTGMTIISAVLAPKRLGLLRQLVPTASALAAMVNPNTPEGQMQSIDMHDAVQALGLRLRVLEARDDKEIDNAMASLGAEKADALMVASDPVFDVNRDKIVQSVARIGIPAIYQFRDYAAAGGLMSYDPDLVDAHRQAGVYAGKILGGSKPSDLPILQPTKFQLVINLKAAKALGLDVPPTLLATADEVIE